MPQINSPLPTKFYYRTYISHWIRWANDVGRKKRYWNPHAYFHVTMRGNNRQPIFQTIEDKKNLMRAIEFAFDKYPFTMLAYCVMSNHYHLLIRSEVELSKVMACINRRYSDYYARRYGHVGRIYEKRYFSKFAKGPNAIRDISSYIHRNPIDTTIPLVKKLHNYHYSSFPYYADDTKTPPRYLNTSLVATFLPKPYEQTNYAYCLYCLAFKLDISQVYDDMPID